MGSELWSGFRLGERRVCPDVNEIDETRIDAKAMEVLVALAEVSPAVVSGSALLERVWPNVVVVDNVIHQAISQLRKALGDHARSPRYIECIPRRGYRLVARLETDASQRAGMGAVDSVPVLAVLDFENLSTDPELAFFASGVSQEIRDTVSQKTSIKVIARDSSSRFHNPEKGRNVAHRLRATHILDGSVKRSATKIRICAELVEVDGSVTIWAGRFDGELSDVFALQDDVATAVTSLLKSKIVRSGDSVTNIAFYDLYLKARLFSRNNFSDGEHLDAAVGMLEAVVADAPRFARAWAELARARARCVTKGSNRVNIDDVVDAAERALQLDPQLGSAYLALGIVEPPGCYQQREALARTAHAVSPNDSEIFVAVAEGCAVVGRSKDSLTNAQQALELDPFNDGAINWVGCMLYWVGRYEDSRDFWDEALNREKVPEYIIFNAVGAAGYRHDWDRLEALMLRAHRAGRETENLRQYVRHLRDIRDPTPQFIQGCLKHAKENLDRHGTVSLSAIYDLYHLGLRDQAFDLVEKASFDHLFDRSPSGLSKSWSLMSSGVIFHSNNEEMMRDKRFVGLCAKLGLCDYWARTGRWPDLVDEVGDCYDLKAESRRFLSETRASSAAP